VVKPATATPFSALAIAELAERAGVPKGVFSVVTGSASAIGGEMTGNPLVRKITFTGSTEIGKVLMEQSAKTVKKASMELGGNACGPTGSPSDVFGAMSRIADMLANQARSISLTVLDAS
jgi:acyl-CoA reductase-like NAD-dependent aldehyde dehydrogenase